MWDSTWVRHPAGMQLGQEQACPQHGQPSPSPGCWPSSWPLSANCLVEARLWLPPGHESDSHPGVSAGAAASIPAGHGHFEDRQAPGNSLLQVVPSEFTGLHCQAVWAETLRHTRNKTRGDLPAGKQEGLGGIWAMAVMEGSIPQVLLGLEMFS